MITNILPRFYETQRTVMCTVMAYYYQYSEIKLQWCDQVQSKTPATSISAHYTSSSTFHIHFIALTRTSANSQHGTRAY